VGSADAPNVPPVGDQSFDEFYYVNCCGRPYRRDDEWLAFFGGIAGRIVSDLQPTRVLDAGCALGLLVETLRDRGVEAFGLDLSTYAIEHVHPSVKPFCWHGSITDPLEQRYDLIVSIEVVEHMPAREAEHAIENLCAHTERVLFSSSPLDYREPTHVNVHPTDYWGEQFARYGFYRDVDFDASFITPWAALFRKSGEPIHRLIRGYERRFCELQSNSNGARSYSIEIQERLTRTEAERDSLRAQLEQVHGDLGQARTELVQVHGDLGQARTELVQVHAELNRAYTHAREQAAAFAAERDGLARQLSFAVETIANMERSVFWRIRGAYLKIRRMIQPNAS
jgi:SAM-dependent methyltransferase